MNYRPRLNIDALIFSCYDVLVDVTASYREVTRKSVQIYLERAMGLPPSSEDLISADEVVLVQRMGNFTNYWDVTKAFAMYFVELLPTVPIPTFPSRLHVPSILAYLQFAGGNLRVSIDSLRELKDIPGMAGEIAAAGGGIGGAEKALPAENRHILVASGDITKTNIVGRIFQELYLGADLFERSYGQPAIIIQSSGCTEHESLIMAPDVLAQLGQKLPLGVISSHPRNELERSLKKGGIRDYFQSIVALDEIRAANARPVPAPWSLIEAARLLQPTPAHTGYVGAVGSDIQAARTANKTVPFTAIGCLAGAPDKAEMQTIFEAHKANMILGHPNNLKELILG